jgi:hypothetical protein
MHLAWRYGADRIWIVNVGDIKPMELPIDFFLSYAWDPERWPYERLGEFSRSWAARQFGAEHAAAVVPLLDGYAKLNRQRTPELLEPDTYSLIHPREAERHLERWRELVAGAERLEAVLPAEAQDAFFQLVSYPVRASAIARELNVAAGLNRLYALQGRAAGATALAARVRALYEEDRALVTRYHTLGGGKWNHMMAQIKYGYTYWQVPPVEVLPAVSEARPNPGPEPALAVEGDPHGRPRWGTPAPVLPSIDHLRRNTRWIELFNRGDAGFSYEAKVEAPWLRVTPASGRVEDQVRLEVGADWPAVPEGATEAFVSIETSARERFRVRVPIADTRPAAGAPAGTFLEADGHLAIDAAHYARAVDEGGSTWKTLADFGRGAGAVTLFPVLGPERAPGGRAPRLEYDLQLAGARPVTLEFQFAPSLDFQPGEGLRFAWSLGGAAPEVVKLGTWQTLQTWEKAVADSVRRVAVKADVAAGHQVLKYWQVTPGVVLERIVIDAGGLRPSYLGPPESPRLP